MQNAFLRFNKNSRIFIARKIEAKHELAPTIKIQSQYYDIWCVKCERQHRMCKRRTNQMKIKIIYENEREKSHLFIFSLCKVATVAAPTYICYIRRNSNQSKNVNTPVFSSASRINKKEKYVCSFFSLLSSDAANF